MFKAVMKLFRSLTTLLLGLTTAASVALAAPTGLGAGSAGTGSPFAGGGQPKTVTVQLEPEEAFGDYDETALIIRPETDFEEGVEVGLSYTEIRGETLDRPYRVTDIADGVVVLDGNHPLAGIGLKFEITVKNVEPVKKGMETVGTDDVVVPSFLQVSDKPMVANIVDDAGDEETNPTVH